MTDCLLKADRPLTKDERRANRIAEKIVKTKKDYHSATSLSRKAKLAARFEVLCAQHKALVRTIDDLNAVEVMKKNLLAFTQ